MQRGFSPGVVVAVNLSAAHEFSKPVQQSIRLLLGLGVGGDAHLGVTVQHRSRVAKDPTRPNLRQVHLVHAELHDELRAGGFQIAPGRLARTSPRAALTCSRCHGERGSTSVVPQSSA